MKINPKSGIGELLFGMKQPDVISIYGQPDKKFTDDEKNVIMVYNKQQFRLTFYEDEQFRMGYIISSNPELEMFGHKAIGEPVEKLKELLISNGFKMWEKEDFDITENHFNESGWITLSSEFGRIVKVELGAIINDKDEFDWKFTK